MFIRMGDMDNVFGAMDLLRNKMDRFLDGFDKSFDYGSGLSFTAGGPRTTLYEEKDAFEIRVEVPGIAKEDLKVNIQGNYLEIMGSRTIDAPEGYKVHRSERGTRSFSRNFTLPDGIDAEKVEAALRDGILYLKLPKSEVAKPKQIAIG